LSPQTQKTKLLISIVSYNSLNYVVDLLNSLKQNPPSFPYRTVVVDNRSSDGTAEHLKQDYSWVDLIENPDNKGFAAANNRAMAAFDSDYVLLINSDCQLYPGSVQNLISFLEENPRAAIAGPKIINSDGTLQPSCRRFPSMFNAALHSLLTAFYPHNPFSRKYKLMEADKSKPFEVDWVSGSCMAIRRQALEQVGSLDERYFMYVEDLDLCYRVWQKGWKVYYFPYSQVLHHIGGSSRGRNIRASYLMQKSVFYFYWKHYRKSWKVCFLPVLLVVLALRFLVTAAKSLLFRKSRS